MQPWKNGCSDPLGKVWQFRSNLLRNGYSGLFEVADYDFKVRILNFKVAVYLKIMYLEIINIIEKVYADKFQLESSKKWFMARKIWKTL